MKYIIILFLTCIFFSSCDLFDELFGVKETENKLPSYKTKIAWASNLVSNSYTDHTVDNDSVFFFERPPGYKTVNIYALTRLNAQTGALIWRSRAIFRNTIFSQPIVIDGYVYVFLQPSGILCFDYETGEQTATVYVNIDYKGLRFNWDFPVAYQEYIYLSLYSPGTYFVRLDSRLINQRGDFNITQVLAPQILWELENRQIIETKPVIYNNTVFTATSGFIDKPIEIAGFDLDSLEMVFHCSFGGSQDQADYGNSMVYYDRGGDVAKILVHKDILYFIGPSRSAWDIGSSEKIYRHINSNNVPNAERCHADCLQPLYYKGKIYYTNQSSYRMNDSFRNIQCIDAATGKLVWNTIAKDSESLYTNPIIAHGKLYISQYDGFFVYDPKTGKLLGVDQTFKGAGRGRNVLYNDLMICVRYNKNDEGKLVAVYVGK